jgi:hypothetical protein
MRPKATIRRGAVPIVLSLPLALSACVTARMHSEAELGAVTQACGLGAGELFQDESEPRLLFLFRPGAAPAERHCAARWARRNHLHLAYVEAVDAKDH